jgi:hypothetical protein
LLAGACFVGVGLASCLISFSIFSIFSVFVSLVFLGSAVTLAFLFDSSAGLCFSIIAV